MNFRLLALVILFAACSNLPEPEPTFATGDGIVGLATPITLLGDTTTVLLSDYFADTAVDSILLIGGVDHHWSLGSDSLFIEGRLPNHLGVMHCFVGGVDYAILLKNAALVRHRFEFTASAKPSVVQLAGDFNGWQPSLTPMNLESGTWVAELELYPGNYSYQLVVDGRYMLDPSNDATRSNGMGGYNSVVTVALPKGSEKPHLQAVAAYDGKVHLASSSTENEVFAFVNNHLIEHSTVGEEISISLPKTEASDELTFVRVWTANADGHSNEVKIALKNGVPVTDAQVLGNALKERSVLYFMMVDRFHNGDTTNDEPLEDVRVAPRANYQGGDLRGISKKLEEGYFSDLGINTLWISPITQNPLEAYQEYPQPRRFYSGYHGYWPIRFTVVDHRLGNGAELRSLVEATHSKDMKIILDFVSNHVHEAHPFIKAHPEYKTDLILPDGSMNIRIWDEQRLTTWFDTFLPSFDFSKQEVVEVVSDSALFWIETYEFDGFRHDATKHIPESFWRATTQKLKRLSAETGKQYFQVGETFGDRPLIQSYVGSGMMDGQFDFNIYFDAREVFKDTNTSFEVLAASLSSTLNVHGAQHLMCNITGNHDLPRFISLAGGAIGPKDDEKEVGWERDIKLEDTIGYDRLKMLQTFITTIPGLPVIYYGDEVGMAGANDPDNRRMMRFEGLSEHEQSVKQHLKKLLELRAQNLALTYGDLEILKANTDVMILSRTYLNQGVRIAFNNSARPKQITIKDVDVAKWKTTFGNIFEAQNGHAKLVLPPFSSEIIHTSSL